MATIPTALLIAVCATQHSTQIGYLCRELCGRWPCEPVSARARLSIFVARTQRAESELLVVSGETSKRKLNAFDRRYRAEKRGVWRHSTEPNADAYRNPPKGKAPTTEFAAAYYRRRPIYSENL